MALSNRDASIILGMLARGDHNHHIAAYFGENPARIAEVKDGSHGSVSAADPKDLPFKGAAGPKGRQLRARVGKVIDALKADNFSAALQLLEEGAARYDRDEA